MLVYLRSSRASLELDLSVLVIGPWPVPDDSRYQLAPP